MQKFSAVKYGGESLYQRSDLEREAEKLVQLPEEERRERLADLAAKAKTDKDEMFHFRALRSLLSSMMMSKDS